MWPDICHVSSKKAATRAACTRLVSRRQHTMRYTHAYERSLVTPQEFWAEQASDIHWFRPCDKVLDTSGYPIHKWFTGGLMNTSYNALDVHVASGNGDRTALRYDSPLTDTKRSLTYNELLEQVSTFAGGLRKLGVEKGDRVLIYMPAVTECAVAMLACARLGAVHTVVFGGFAAGELAARIDDATPKVIVAASCGVEPKGVVEYEPLLNEALERASWHPSKCVMLQRDVHHAELKKGRDIDWHDLMTKSAPVDAVPVLATDPLYILYTSGTTGKPKGVVRDNGGHAVALKWSMGHVMNTHPGETFWAASDMGWVVGHSYIVYGPLLQGCTSVIYEGKPVGTPDAAAYWRIVSDYGVKTMFTAPTALRAIRKADPDGTVIQNMKAAVHETLKAMFVAGERGDPKTLRFFAEQLEVPVVDNWWQTETGWPMSSQCLGIEQDAADGTFPGIKFGSVSRPVPGYNIQLKTADKTEFDHHHGHHHDSDEPDKELVVKLPLPPGTVTTLYNNDEEFHAKYLKRFPGYYHTGDTGHIDDDGYVYVMSRTDDVINVAGHRLTTGSIEEVIQVIPEVVECAVFGASDPLKGHVPVALLVLKNEITRSEDEIADQVVTEVREHIGSFACLKSVAMVSALPKTRSGKVLRATISAIAESRPIKVPATIENESTLADIRVALQKLGYAEKDRLIK